MNYYKLGNEKHQAETPGIFNIQQRKGKQEYQDDEPCQHFSAMGRQMPGEFNKDLTWTG